MLDNLFGFLRRKTDFYTGASLEKIDALVSTAIRKHYEIFAREQQEKEEKKRREEKKKKVSGVYLMRIINKLIYMYIVFCRRLKRRKPKKKV